MPVTEYKNCKYHIPKLKPIIYLLDSTKIENRIHIDGENAIIDRIENGDVLKIDGSNTELTENASIDERYRFEKEITFTTDGYYSLSNIYNKYYIVVEDYHGNQWVCNVDLPSKPTYNYILDDSNNNTTYTFNILSNFPLIRLRNNISGEEVKHCRYFIGGIKKLQLLEHGKAILNNETREVAIIGDNTWKDIEPFLKSFQESFDGDNFSSTINFTIPLDEYKSHFQYSLLEFNENRYVSIITPLLGSNVIYAGFDEFGLMPTYSIATDNTNIVTISLNGSSKCVFTEEYDSYQDGTLRWIPISSATTDRGEYMTSFECSSVDGYAKYLLLQEIDAFGRPTGNYKALEGYEEDYNHFINIIGTFDDEILFKHDDCKFKCQTISNIPNVIVFSSVTSYTYTISSLCPWTIDNSNLPSGVTVSPLSGESGITNITISCTDVGRNEGNYSIVLHTQDEDIPSTISVRLSKNEEYSVEIDARRQNVDFNTIFPIEYLYGDITRIIGYNVMENYIKFDIPRNDSTEERLFNIIAEDIYGSEITFHILQYGIVQEWREEDDDYVCVGGDLYTVATLWSGYTQSELVRTNEQKPYTMSVPRSEECEQFTMWQWNGDTICSNGNLYKLETLMVSSDGYEWRETEETRIGDLIEESSLDCAENIYQIDVRTKDEVGSSIWTTIIVKTGDTVTSYTDVSACTFTVAENAPYEISFADKANYLKPDPISGIATASTSYTAVYTTIRKYNIGVSTIDNNRNYIITDIEVCVGGQCTTYQNTSGVTFDVIPNQSFTVNFENVSGYITPPSITSTGTADVNYVAVYNAEVNYNLNVISNIPCDMLINGTTYSSITTTSVTMASGTSYSVSFGSIEHYITPQTQTGVLTGNTTISVEYERIVLDYLNFTARDGAATIGMSGNTTPNISYSFDKENWTTWNYSNITLNEDQTVWFKGVNTTIDGKRFTMSGYVEGKGSIQSLLYGDDFEGQLTIPNNSCFYGLFSGCTSLTTAPQLPATTLADYCYTSMFQGCTSLTTAPQLPATTLEVCCYGSMFQGCTSLTTAPQLLATTLVDRCYNYMFYGCTSLTSAPQLLATTLADYCYTNMFYGCTSLTTAPQLPATTLASSCYNFMFTNCTSLTTAPQLPATTLADYCYTSMFQGCTSLTTAPQLLATTLASGCYQSMFNGCTSLTTAPQLPATTLAEYCYYGMFQSCKSLTTAPQLLATTLVNNCYSHLFYNCTKLNYIKAMFTTMPSSTYTNIWVQGVASRGTFVKNANATWNVSGASGVPNNWTIQYASS